MHAEALERSDDDSIEDICPNAPPYGVGPNWAYSHPDRGSGKKPLGEGRLWGLYFEIEVTDVIDSFMALRPPRSRCAYIIPTI